MRASAAGRPEEVLELDPGASPKEIQTAWRDLSLALHPDKVRGALTADEATEAMKAVNHAKDVLLGDAPRTLSGCSASDRSLHAVWTSLGLAPGSSSSTSSGLPAAEARMTLL